MAETALGSHRRTAPRSALTALCWEVSAGKERTGLVVDLSWQGVRLERPFIGGATAAEVQLEITVAGIDEVIWARAGSCFDQVVAAPGHSAAGGPLGLVRRTGYRLLAAAARDLRLLREFLIERRRAEANARGLPSILAHDFNSAGTRAYLP